MKTMRFIYLLPLLFITVRASQQNLNSNLQPGNKDTKFQKSIDNYLPKFLEKNKQIQETTQKGSYHTVLVLGPTGAGKSTLIGGLLGHKFAVEMCTVSTMRNGSQHTRKVKRLLNKVPNAPKIGYNQIFSETSLLEVYLDQITSLAFIDTIGFNYTGKDEKVIRQCTSIALCSLIEKISNVKCIIGVATYNSLVAGRGLTTFYELLYVISNLLKNQLPETIASSIVLVFTKVPNDITEDDVNDALIDLCDDLVKSKHEMKNKFNEVEQIYRLLFPSFYNIENKKDVPYFLIRENDLLKQNLVRNNMLPTLQKAKPIVIKSVPRIDKEDEDLVQNELFTTLKPSPEPPTINQSQNNLTNPNQSIQEKKEDTQQDTNLDETQNNLTNLQNQEPTQLYQEQHQQDDLPQSSMYHGTPQPLHQHETLTNLLQQSQNKQQQDIDEDNEREKNTRFMMDEIDQAKQELERLYQEQHQQDDLPQPLYQYDKQSNPSQQYKNTQQDINFDQNQNNLTNPDDTQQQSIDDNIEQPHLDNQSDLSKQKCIKNPKKTSVDYKSLGLGIVIGIPIGVVVAYLMNQNKAKNQKQQNKRHTTQLVADNPQQEKTVTPDKAK